MTYYIVAALEGSYLKYYNHVHAYFFTVPMDGVCFDTNGHNFEIRARHFLYENMEDAQSQLDLILERKIDGVQFYIAEGTPTVGKEAELSITRLGVQYETPLCA